MRFIAVIMSLFLFGCVTTAPKPQKVTKEIPQCTKILADFYKDAQQKNFEVMPPQSDPIMGMVFAVRDTETNETFVLCFAEPEQKSLGAACLNPGDYAEVKCSQPPGALLSPFLFFSKGKMIKNFRE